MLQRASATPRAIWIVLRGPFGAPYTKVRVAGRRLELSCAAGRRRRWRTPDEVRRCATYPRKIQAESKLGQIDPNPAKPGQTQPREKLGFPCPNRALSRTCADPPGRFFFRLPGSPASPRARRTALRQESLPVFHVYLV